MLHDISVEVRVGTPEWPGDAPFECGWTARLADGASVNLSRIGGSPHVGTVLDYSDAPSGPISIDVDDLRLAGVKRLLLRTGRCIASGRFPSDWPVLDRGVATRLTERGVRLLGVDAPSVDARHSTQLEVHHALFGGGAYVLENLDLRGVRTGHYELIALPQRLAGLDAAPVRAVLRSR